ncbi:MAG: hypothetical protein JXK05_11670 [Campylobacterales bacterium]|nr:hypothetical protein [Campylobacterales bacterium]
MRGANFVSFFTVGGFFIGLFFALLKAHGAFELLSFIFTITLFFYLFSHLFVGLFVNTLTPRPSYFSKKGHEKDLDHFIREINKREVVIDAEYDSFKGFKV